MQFVSVRPPLFWGFMTMEQWQIDLRGAFRRMTDLLDYLEFDSTLRPPFSPSSDTVDEVPPSAPLTIPSGPKPPVDSSRDFPLRVTTSFAKRMKKNDPKDPLFLQIAFQKLENLKTPHFLQDAVGDLNSIVKKGLIQKYEGRVLVIATGVCAVHCRYCFRRHFPYSEQTLSLEDRQSIIETLKTDSQIHEVIFSGGDPLLLNDETLLWWAENLKTIPHLRRWRFHSRLPTVLPSRMTPSLRRCFEVFSEGDERQVILVTHINHPQEINDEVKNGLNLFRGVPRLYLLNQAVLLKGINDNTATLKSLSEGLFEAGILPYYLHALDRTQGVAHFEVSEEMSLSLYKDLSRVLPGYLLPKFVREIEGAKHKVQILPSI